MAAQGPTATTGATPAAMTSRLTQMQMRFQQRQQQERDQRKVELISTTTAKSTAVVASHQNGAGSSSTIRSSAISSYSTTTSSTTNGGGGDLSASLGAGKVRQMFDERRHHRVAGIDKSYPLQPIQQQQQQQQAATGKTNNGSNVSNGNHTGKSSNGGGVSTGLNNKTRVPPISANTKARLAMQQQRQQQQQENGNYGENLKSANFDDNENLLDDEKFPDTISFDEDLTMTPSPIARKLPNVGKPNGQLQNVNSLKLKPVPGRTPAATTTVAKPAPKKPTPVNSALASGATAAQSFPSGCPSPTATSRTNSAKSAASRASTGKSAMATTSAISRKPSATSAPSQPAQDGPIPDGLARCTICGRNFAEDRIVKHREICQKTKTKKRKVFDTTKHRVLGTDAEKYVLRKWISCWHQRQPFS